MSNEQNKFIAHKCIEDGREHLLKEHLEKTALLAKHFADSFGCGELAWVCGILHDYGKYSERFQLRIRGANIAVDHSTPGGQFISNKYMGSGFGNLAKLISYCILGHHGKGLPDGGTDRDNEDEPTLNGRLKKQIPNCDAFLNECDLPPLMPPEINIVDGDDGFTVSFLTRMLFSSLVDADYLNTEHFFNNGNIDRGGFADTAELNNRLNVHIQKYLCADNIEGSLNFYRNSLLNDCITAADLESGLFTLTAPTGSGKTIASLAFALRHAAKRDEHSRLNKQRVIYIVPYNTIIEQTAAVFENEDLLGYENVLQHHSNVYYNDFDDDENKNATDTIQQRKRYSTENWDFPIVITSSVQFFESLFAARPGKCRKLHNIANSVLIFDEAQMIPVSYLKPCTRAIKELVQNYGCTAVLATATQSAIEKYFEPLKPIEISSNPKELYSALQRTTLEVLSDSLTEDDLAELLSNHTQVLCIVNKREDAQRLFTLLKERVSDGVFHLSTTMYPEHRKHVLNKIKQRLNDDDVNIPPCRVVSTSLIEAGVDIDFPVVYREIAGLDSIVQAAGRCNREGKRLINESFVYVFTIEEHNIPSYQEINVNTFKQIARNHTKLDTPEAISAYFEQLYYNKGGSEFDDTKKILDNLNQDIKDFNFKFRKVADEFNLIDNQMKDIYMIEDVPNLEKRLRLGERSQNLFRSLGPYTISLYSNEVNSMRKHKMLDEIDDEVLLLSKCLYDDNVGVNLPPKGGNALFIPET